MKKLMIVAAVAAMSGVASAASACSPNASVTTNATVYAIKFALKTPTGAICSVAGTGASNCGPGAAGVNKYVRTPSTYALQGWLAACKSDCDQISKFTKNDIAIWNTKEMLGMEIATYKIVDDILHVLSKSQADAEIYFDLKGDMKKNVNGAWADDGLTRTFDLHCAGFGKFSKAQGLYTSFNGSVVGTVSKVMYPKAVLKDPSNPALGYECPEAYMWVCADVMAGKGCSDLTLNGKSVAFGTFAINYNAAASKNFRNNRKPAIPAYVVTPSGWNS